MRVAWGAFVALGIAALPACEAVLGLSGETGLPEGGLDARARDARSDAPGADRPKDSSDGGDAARPPHAAIAVTSARNASDWCVVTAAGEVDCWGENENGELGDGTLFARARPTKVVGLPTLPATQVTMGQGTACALTAPGGVYCWGFGHDGERGDGTSANVSTVAVPVAGLGNGVTSVSAEGGVGCAVQDGAVKCWGSPAFGLLGNTAIDALTPVEIPNLTSGVTEVSVGTFVACAVRAGAALCWGGFDGTGALGDGTFSGSFAPVPVRGLTSGVAHVSAGTGFACALTTEGAVLCWGDGTTGTLGNGFVEVVASPAQVSGLSRGVVAISAGADSVSAVKEDGTVVAWGNNRYFDLGAPSVAVQSAVPVPVEGVSGAASISTGRAPCAVTTGGKVLCWGETGENAVTPVSALTTGEATQVLVAGGGSSDAEFVCALAPLGSLGSLDCWGGNGWGQLGVGSDASSTIPLGNPSLSGVSAVAGATGGNFACAVASGLGYCWGENQSGQLGDGTTKSSDVPVAVHALSGLVAIGAGSDFACAIAGGGADGGEAGAGGTVHCWGDNTYGQLGDRTTTSSRRPVQVKGLSGPVTAISLGHLHACALLSDGTVECWGVNTDGELGDNTMITRTSPVPVIGITGATAISAGWYTSCAVTSGSVQCWGDNTTGELGDGSTTSSPMPVAVAGIYTGATQVSVGASGACAIVMGGVWCWGGGPLGYPGVPGLVVPSPVALLDVATGVDALTLGVDFGCANTAAAIHCWGVNTAGQLGNAGAVDAPTPAPVAGFP